MSGQHVTVDIGVMPRRMLTDSASVNARVTPDIVQDFLKKCHYKIMLSDLKYVSH